MGKTATDIALENFLAKVKENAETGENPELLEKLRSEKFSGKAPKKLAVLKFLSENGPASPTALKEALFKVYPHGLFQSLRWSGLVASNRKTYHITDLGKMFLEENASV